MSVENPTSKDFNKLSAYCLSFISIVLFIYILKSLASIIIPFVISGFLAFMLDPVVIFLTRKFKIPRWSAILIVFIIVFGLIYLIGLIAYASFSALPAAGYMDQFNGVYNNMQAYVDGMLNATAQKLKIQIPQFKIEDSLKGLMSFDVVGQSLTTFSSFLFNFVFVIVIWLFMISGKPEFEEKLYYALAKKGSSLEDTIKESVRQIQSYMFAQTVINLANAILNTILFLIYGIPFAPLWGLLVFLLNYIPNIGPIIAVIPPIVIVLITQGLTLPAIIFIVIIVVIQFVEGNVVTPKFMGYSMDLSPVFVMLSIFFWGYVWGITGTFLAVPIAAVIKILVSNIPPLKPFALILCARPKPGKKKKTNAE